MKILSLINNILYEEEKEEKQENKLIDKVDEVLKDGKKVSKKKKEGMFAKKPDKKENGIRVFFNIKANITDTSMIMNADIEGGTGEQQVAPEQPIIPQAPAQPVVGEPAPVTQNTIGNSIETSPLFQSAEIKGEVLNEETYSFVKSGETIITKENSSMISSFESLIDYLEKDEVSKKGAILDEVMANILLIASGVDGSKQLTAVIKKEDYIYCSLDCGNSVEDSIGILVRKVAGVNLVSLNLKKDGNILSAFSLQDFNSELIRYVNDLK